MGLGRYVKNLLIGVDQFGNCILNGSPDETISSRAARRRDKWPWKPLYKTLDHFWPEHCEKSEEAEKEHLHEPPELR